MSGHRKPQNTNTFTDSQTHTQNTHTYIDAPTQSHSHSHKHMRLRHISPQLLCWIHPNMVGDISMATAGRRGADSCGMISRETLLFDFLIQTIHFQFIQQYMSLFSRVRESASYGNTDKPALVTRWLTQ